MGRKKKSEGEHGPGMERWLLTYADLITLLMAFFIVMYAMSNVDAEKYSAMANSLKTALGIEVKGSGLVSNMMTGERAGNDKALSLKGKEKSDSKPSAEQLMKLKLLEEERAFTKMAKKIQDYSDKKGFTGSLKVKEDVRGLVINLSDKLLFESGKADLSPISKTILDDLAGILLGSNKHIKVEGHTDNVPINNARYPSNWQLSTDRATSVIMYWIGKYPNASNRLSASGYGEHHPVAPNDSLWGKTMNRRVEIVILRDAISKGEPTVPGVNFPEDIGDEVLETNR